VAGAEGKIMFDKLHIAKHLGEAVDRIRRRENNTLGTAGDYPLAFLLTARLGGSG
jgi:hypothetical protein